MLQVVVEQKMALASYTSEYSTCQLTPNQLNIFGKVIANVSADTVSVSLIIIPGCCGEHDNDRGVQTMKSEMLNSLKTIFREEQTYCDHHTPRSLL